MAHRYGKNLTEVSDLAKRVRTVMGYIDECGVDGMLTRSLVDQRALREAHDQDLVFFYDADDVEGKLLDKPHRQHDRADQVQRVGVDDFRQGVAVLEESEVDHGAPL